MQQIITSFLTSDISTATPLLIAGLGIVFSERAGLVNIGTEGMMLMGALMGVLGSYLTGSAIIGAFLAMFSAMIVALVFAYFTITLCADQIVVGTAINIFVGGFTIALNRLFFGVKTSVPIIDTFKKVAIPGLSKIPVVGEAFFNQPLLVYLAFLLVPVAWFVLNRTNMGLNIRAVGENPKACDTLGINVFKVRYLTVLYSGAMAGLAGAFVSMGQLSFFLENMIAGRGFITLAAVVFGNYSPIGVMIASIIFGAGSALQYRLQALNMGIPYQFLVMLPYVVTVLAICLLNRRSKKPAASSVPYVREG